MSILSAEILKFTYLIVNDDASVILKIEESTIFSSECLPLSDYDSRHNLFTELRFALLYSR